jgi:hypothetical protein
VVAEASRPFHNELTTETYQRVFTGMDEAAAERAGQAYKITTRRLVERWPSG